MFLDPPTSVSSPVPSPSPSPSSAKEAKQNGGTPYESGTTKKRKYNKKQAPTLNRKRNSKKYRKVQEDEDSEELSLDEDEEMEEDEEIIQELDNEDEDQDEPVDEEEDTKSKRKKRRVSTSSDMALVNSNSNSSISSVNSNREKLTRSKRGQKQQEQQVEVTSQQPAPIPENVQQHQKEQQPVQQYQPQQTYHQSSLYSIDSIGVPNNLSFSSPIRGGNHNNNNNPNLSTPSPSIPLGTPFSPIQSSFTLFQSPSTSTFFPQYTTDSLTALTWEDPSITDFMLSPHKSPSVYPKSPVIQQLAALSPNPNILRRVATPKAAKTLFPTTPTKSNHSTSNSNPNFTVALNSKSSLHNQSDQQPSPNDQQKNVTFPATQNMFTLRTGITGSFDTINRRLSGGETRQEPQTLETPTISTKHPTTTNAPKLHILNPLTPITPLTPNATTESPNFVPNTKLSTKKPTTNVIGALQCLDKNFKSLCEQAQRILSTQNNNNNAMDGATPNMSNNTLNAQKIV